MNTGVTVVMIITPIIAFLVLVLNTVNAYFMARLNRTAGEAAIAGKDAAVEVKEVKRVLEVTSNQDHAKMGELLQIAQDTHTLVNSNMALQLKISALALRRVAELDNTEENRQAADLAAESYSEHEKKQASVDAGKMKP